MTATMLTMRLDRPETVRKLKQMHIGTVKNIWLGVDNRNDNVHVTDTCLNPDLYEECSVIRKSKDVWEIWIPDEGIFDYIID